MADILALKKQRSSNKGRLTNIINYLKSANDDTPVEEYKTRLARVEQLMSEFTAIENKIFHLDPLEESDHVYEENYYTAVTGLNTRIRAKSITAGNISPDISFNMTNAANHNEVKLPKISIPLFSGDYREWQSFYDMFCSTIHESAKLSPVQKFQYLVGLLRGEATVLLRHISITESNYIGALNKLKSRYDRKRHIINVFLRTFIEQPAITNANPDNVKRLMDTSDEVIRGLKALGENAENRDHWLIFLMVQKLDDKSRVLWSEYVADLENPQFSDFLKFLARRIDALETVNMSVKKSISQIKVKSHVTIENQNSTYSCALCSDGDHYLSSCQQFNEMDAEKRKDWAKSKNRCFNCLSRRHVVKDCPSKGRCRICHNRHHTLLHEKEDAKTNFQQPPVTAEATTSLCSQNSSKYTILPTAMIKILDCNSRPLVCRALLDSGSQTTFISESCVQRLGLKKTNARISIAGLGSSNAGFTKGKVSLVIRPNHHPEISMEALILSKITSNLPHQSFENIYLDSWPEVQLADPQFYKSSQIDVLIGADYFFGLLETGQIKIRDDNLILQKTVLGWIVSGSCNRRAENIVSMFAIQSNVDLDKTLRMFWELESISTNEPILSPEETLCENHFTTNTKIDNDGRFIVGLPYKKSVECLGQSLHTAIQRLRTMERRFAREPEFQLLYKDFMQEYQALHHMEEIRQPDQVNTGYYLPHHGVLKQSSSTTKLKVVFDGSSKSTTGTSLNECLAVGPIVQRTLYSIILRFREHKLSTVTYGLASSSFLATRVLKEIADNNEISYPQPANVIRNSIYVDDLMTGADTEIEINKLKEDINRLLLRHGFNLRKWMSNSSNIYHNADNESKEDMKTINDIQSDELSPIKILGLTWNPETDHFAFTSQLAITTAFTFTILNDESKTQWFEYLLSRYSTLTKLKTVMTYILRFVNIMKKQNTARTVSLTREEIFSSLYKICEHEQLKFYPEEIQQLRAGQEVHKTSSIKSLNPFLDKDGLLRVGGRLENANIEYSTKHPIILHPKSQLSMLAIYTIHMDSKHSGPSLTLAISRQEFWIQRGRNLVRQVINRCVICTKFKANVKTQLMGNLPSARVELVRPFLKVGVDYAGPILIHMRKGRGQKAFKSYVCLFICLSTKAIHLELVGDLSSEAFLGALRRFVSRRGVCQEIFSDNGTNFVGADRKLKEEFRKIIQNSKIISAYSSRQCISWHFIPPAAPHFGGIWEAGVKSAKYHLRRVIGNTILTQEEMNTLLAEIESILNSRPLCSIIDADTDVLTPSHFLIGHSYTKIPELDITCSNPSHLTRWQIVQQLKQHFWKRWSLEYLTTMQTRSKWRETQAPVKIDDVIVLKDNNTPVNQWLLGKVITLHPGADGLVRVVTVKTSSGEIVRPINKICVLPTANEDNATASNIVSINNN